MTRFEIDVISRGCTRKRERRESERGEKARERCHAVVAVGDVERSR